MAERIFIVANYNGNGLNVRSKPDTKTGAVTRWMTNGEGFQATDVFTLGNETWARVSRGDNVIQEYACIAIGNRIYCREQVSVTGAQLPAPATSWAQALDEWARSKGFTGPRP